MLSKGTFLATQLQVETFMTTIKIDEKDYDLDTLSEETKAQILSIQFVDAELQRLQAQAAVLQTARASYSRALQEAMGTTPVPPAVDAEAIKLG